MANNTETSSPRGSLLWTRTFLLWLKHKWGILKRHSSEVLGAIAGAVIVTVALLAYLSTIIVTGLGTAINILLFIFSTMISIAAIASLLRAIVTLFKAIPQLVVSTTIGSLIALVLVPLLLLGKPPLLILLLLLLIGVVIIPLEALLGAAIGAVLDRKFRRATTSKQVTILALLASIVASNIVGIAWLANPGSDAHLVEKVESVAPPQLDLPNPAVPGRYQVQTWFYGSGTDKRRPEYGKVVKLKTTTVDVSPFLPQFTGLQAKLHQWFWGFNTQHFPLNAQVWFPVGDGAFPLVLIVHGRHSADEFSEPGYAYLGELLASRGSIAVSVDENFLNGPWLSDRDEAMPIRAWILLQHLKVWRTWNATTTNPFYNKVDLTQIAPIGHSRGGEAIAVAAVFNQLPCYPDNANIKFDFNFAIESLVAIAPTDRLYQPAGQPVLLKDINYLVLHGSHDSDVSRFEGMRQYQRLQFTERQSWFKSALYIYRANHGQFNTVWGRTDQPPPFSWLLNLKPLLDGEAQRRIAKIYISAFLEATVRGDRRYIPLFQDYRIITSWLPETIYKNRFQAASDRVVSNYEEDINPITTTVLDGVEQADNFEVWREQELLLRSKSHLSQENSAVYLEWDRADIKADPSAKIARSYTINLPHVTRQNWQIDRDKYLAFDLANATNEESRPLDFIVELIDSKGTMAALPLSQFAPIQYPLKIQISKLNWLEGLLWKPSELVLQTYQLLLADFMKISSQFNPAQIETIRFRFDRAKAGAIFLDEVVFRTNKDD